MAKNGGKSLIAIEKALALQAKEFAPALKAIENLKQRSEFQRLAKEISQHQELMRRMLGPMEDFRRLTQSFGLLAEMDKVRALTATYEAQFRMPALDEINRTMALYRDGPIARLLAQRMDGASAMSRAIQSMRVAWVDPADPLRSLGGLSGLQAIGQAVNAMPAFNDELSSLLRGQLGDWRERISWPDGIFDDIVERSAFYEAQGLNPALTEFPAPAFAEALERAELPRAPPTLVDLYGEPVPLGDDDEQEDALERTNQAHDWLLRLETQIRACIDTLMTAAFGADWPQHRLPNGMLEKWVDKKAKAEKAGARASPLIAFSDFTDYELIICRSDNWNRVFMPVFGRPESIRESFQRLYPIRVCTMHARTITQDDELLLYVETRRIIKAVRQAG